MSRAKFRFQEGFSRIYRVGPKLQYATIQAAIDQAVADLVTPNAQNYTLAAQVEIYDKGSAYTENLSIYPGIHLKGIAPRQGAGIPITGNHTLTFTAGQAAQTQAQNTLYLNDLAFTSTAGRVFTLGGTAPVDVRLTDCSVVKTGTVDGLEAFLCSNSNATARVRLTDVTVQFNDTQGVAGTSYAIRCQGSFQFEWQGGRGGFFSGFAGNATPIRLEGSAQFRITSGAGFAAGGASGVPFPTQISAYGPYVVELAGASSGATFQNVTVANAFANGSFINYVAAGGARVLNCHIGLQSISSKIGNGASGAFIYKNMTVEGTYTGNVTTGRNNIDSGITVTEIKNSLRFTTSQWERSWRVGEGGYSTVQDAIDAADAATGWAFKSVIVPPGNYNEDIILPLGLYLVGESRSKSGLQPEVNIRSITVDPSYGALGGTGESWIENINFLRSTPGVCFKTVGAAPLNAVFNRCMFNSQGAGTTDPLVALKNTNVSSLVMFKDCSFIFESDNAAVPMFELDHYLQIMNESRSFSGQDIFSILFNNSSGAVLPIFKLAASVVVDCHFKSIFSPSGSSKLAEIAAGATLSMFACDVTLSNMAHPDNELITYTGAGTFSPRHCVISFNDNPYEGLLARDSGSRAVATVTVDAGNTFDPGDAVVVNGVSLVNGVDWAVGATASDTADNIRAAINASVNPAIQGVVYARNVGAVISVYTRKNGAGQNAPTNTLSVVDGGGISFTGVSTFGGGVNGAGGTFSYGACVFDVETKIDGGLTVITKPIVAVTI